MILWLEIYLLKSLYLTDSGNQHNYGSYSCCGLFRPYFMTWGITNTASISLSDFLTQSPGLKRVPLGLTARSKKFWYLILPCWRPPKSCASLSPTLCSLVIIYPIKTLRWNTVHDQSTFLCKSYFRLRSLTFCVVRTGRWLMGKWWYPTVESVKAAYLGLMNA